MEKARSKGIPDSSVKPEKFMLDVAEDNWTYELMEHDGSDITELDDEAREAYEERWMFEGCNRAAISKVNAGVYQSALSSWLKMFALLRIETAHISKEQWLILARIYVGLGDVVHAHKTLKWVEACAATDPENFKFSIPLWRYGVRVFSQIFSSRAHFP